MGSTEETLNKCPNLSGSKAKEARASRGPRKSSSKGAAVLMRSREASIHVANLPKGTCERDLYNLFRDFGIINSFCLALDEKSGTSMQSATVEFDQREDAEMATSWFNGYVYGEHTLRIELATPYVLPPTCINCIRDAETSIRVNNLSEDTCEPDLYNLIRLFGVVVRYYLAVDQKITHRKVGIVEFDQREDAEEAIKWLDGH
ncbi:hypothetical protein EJB05_19673, partial [Eragrostis curvula]